MDFDQRSCADGLCGWLGRRIALFLALTFFFSILALPLFSPHHGRGGVVLMFHIPTVRSDGALVLLFVWFSSSEKVCCVMCDM